MLLLIIIFCLYLFLSAYYCKKKNYSILSNYTSLSYFQMWYYLSYFITQKKASIAIVRYGDGENIIMNRKSIPINSQATNIDKFHFSGGVSKLGVDLNISLTGQFGKNYIYCIPFYNPIFTELLNKIDQKREYIFTANIFVNGNYRRTTQLLYSLIYDEFKSIILFCNKDANHTEFAEEVIYFPNEIIKYYELNKYSILSKIKHIAKKYSYRLFIVSVGPLSEVLIWNMYNINVKNRYIDFGSSVDELIKHKVTRGYAEKKSKASNSIDPYFRINKDKQISFIKMKEQNNYNLN